TNTPPAVSMVTRRAGEANLNFRRDMNEAAKKGEVIPGSLLAHAEGRAVTNWRTDEAARRTAAGEPPLAPDAMPTPGYLDEEHKKFIARWTAPSGSPGALPPADRDIMLQQANSLMPAAGTTPAAIVPAPAAPVITGGPTTGSPVVTSVPGAA